MRILMYLIATVSGLILFINVSGYFFDYLLSSAPTSGSDSMALSTETIGSGQWRYLEYYHENKKINRRIEKCVDKAMYYDDLYNWFTLSITILTTGTTFVSSLQAARKDPSDHKSARKYLIICAVLAFLSGALNSFANQFNSRKSDALKSAAILSKS